MLVLFQTLQKKTMIIVLAGWCTLIASQNKYSANKTEISQVIYSKDFFLNNFEKADELIIDNIGIRCKR